MASTTRWRTRTRATTTSWSPARDGPALVRFASLHPYALEAKAEVIIEHFRNKTAAKIDGRAKAMVVTGSRLHAVRTQAVLAAYIARKGYDTGERPLRTLVAFSGAVLDPDMPEAPEVTEAQSNGFPESQLPAKHPTPPRR